MPWRTSGTCPAAPKARRKGARDSTKYGRSRTSTKSYFVHHCQRLSLTAKQFNAKAILKSLAGYNQVVSGPAGRGPRASSAQGAAA